MYYMRSKPQFLVIAGHDAPHAAGHTRRTITIGTLFIHRHLPRAQCTIFAKHAAHFTQKNASPMPRALIGADALLRSLIDDFHGKIPPHFNITRRSRDAGRALIDDFPHMMIFSKAGLLLLTHAHSSASSRMRGDHFDACYAQSCARFRRRAVTPLHYIRCSGFQPCRRFRLQQAQLPPISGISPLHERFSTLFDAGVRAGASPSGATGAAFHRQRLLLLTMHWAMMMRAISAGRRTASISQKRLAAWPHRPLCLSLPVLTIRRGRHAR